MSTWGTSNQNCLAEPFLSSRATKSWAKWLFYTPKFWSDLLHAAVKGAVFEYEKPWNYKTSDSLLPLPNYFSFTISHSPRTWITDHNGTTFEELKRECWCAVVSTAKGRCDSVRHKTEFPHFQGRTLQVGRQKANTYVLWFEKQLLLKSLSFPPTTSPVKAFVILPLEMGSLELSDFLVFQ